MQKNLILFRLSIFVMLVTVTAIGSMIQAQRKDVVDIVAKIRRADYEGDRAALRQRFEDLDKFVGDKKLGAKVRYWRGFARWRSAINGFNDSGAPVELERDIKAAIAEFESAIALEPAFVDARASAGSCMGLLLFLYATNPDLAPEFKDRNRMQEYGLNALSYLNDAETAAPENPRVLWMLGTVRWRLPPERGGGQDKAIETYQKGLKAIRARKSNDDDKLTPSWGEPELLMSLAYSYLNRTNPDIDSAERNALAALRLVPFWHYVRDILIPQIAAAKAKKGLG